MSSSSTSPPSYQILLVVPELRPQELNVYFYLLSEILLPRLVPFLRLQLQDLIVRRLLEPEPFSSPPLTFHSHIPRLWVLYLMPLQVVVQLDQVSLVLGLLLLLPTRQEVNDLLGLIS